MTDPEDGQQIKILVEKKYYPVTVSGEKMTNSDQETYIHLLYFKNITDITGKIGWMFILTLAVKSYGVTEISKLSHYISNASYFM